MNSYEYTLHEAAERQPPAPYLQKEAPEKIRCISFQDVSFQYNGRLIINNLNFQLAPGDFLAITGASGKGKTTILNLVLGFLKPYSGKILVNDSLQATDRRHWNNISYVKQQSFLIHDTILRNIVLDETEYDAQRLQLVIERSGLTELAGPGRGGLQKLVAENGKNISGGQRQRIAIARALYKNADLYILDEPFNELDENAERCLLEYFKELASTGKMIVLITHDPKSLSFCNKKISLDEWVP